MSNEELMLVPTDELIVELLRRGDCGVIVIKKTDQVRGITVYTRRWKGGNSDELIGLCSGMATNFQAISNQQSLSIEGLPDDLIP